MQDGQSFDVEQFRCTGWPEPQARLTSLGLVIPVMTKDRQSAGRETDQRFPHMVVRQSRYSDTERRKFTYQGFIVEHVVKRYFRSAFPLAYCDAVNDGQWTVPCGHDFRVLRNACCEALVDVFQKNYYSGCYISPHKTMRGADLYLCCRTGCNTRSTVAGNVVCEGYLTEFPSGQQADELLPIDDVLAQWGEWNEWNRSA